MSENSVKRPLYKKWWFWVVLGVVSTMFFGLMGSCGDTETDDDYETFGNSVIATSFDFEDTTTEPITTEETTAEPTTIVKTTVEVTEAPTQVVVPDNEISDERENGYNGAIPVIEEIPVEDNGQDYVLNNNTMKFHYPSCASAKKIKAENREDYYGTRDELIDRGYDPCGNCHP